MAFDVKELMIDITKAGVGEPQYCFWPSRCGWYTCAFATCLCSFRPTICYWGTNCPATYIAQAEACKLGTYTCLDTRLTCAGTPYCAGTEPLPYGQGIDPEALAAVKAQLQAALKEVEQHEKQMAKKSK
jgi:hypothetical protein